MPGTEEAPGCKGFPSEETHSQGHCKGLDADNQGVVLVSLPKAFMCPWEDEPQRQPSVRVPAVLALMGERLVARRGPGLSWAGAQSWLDTWARVGGEMQLQP